MISLDVDASDLSAISDSIGATPRLAQKAQQRALNRTAAWVRTRVRRAVAKETGMPAKVLAPRMIIRRASGTSTSAALWIGLDPVNPVRLGARQTRRGVSARRHRFEGAFIARGRGGSRRVFKRVTNDRLPLEVQNIAVAAAGRAAIRKPAFDATEYFLREFERDLKHRMERARA